MTVTCYTARQKGLNAPVRAAIAADLHNGPWEGLLRAIEREQPDLILLPGDFLHKPGETARGFAFLTAAAKLCPTFCSVGNHEVRCRIPDLADRVGETGAVLLDNDCRFAAGLWLGGLSSGYRMGMRQGRTLPTPPPDRRFLSAFARIEGPRLLLCHHPEYYEPYLRETDIPLILAGHAHGGQWELFGRGVFAPGQGLFPRYTAGFYDGRMIVSRGLRNTYPLIPRLFNPRELVLLDVWPEE